MPTDPGDRPAPPPAERREELPQQRPKPPADDPAAPQAVRRILASPSYRIAFEDPQFLQRPELRGTRLMLDYLKPQLVLQDHAIAHTIVVFGGTRICEPGAARRGVEFCAAALAANPDDPVWQERHGRAERVLAKSLYYDIARDFGRLVGAAGDQAIGGRLTIVTGGGPGIMEAANRGASDAGAPSIGLNISLPSEQYPNPYITPELSFHFHYFAMRKLHFLLRARALVAFPGGYGTLDELFEVLTLAQTRKIDPVPVILVGEDYWRRVFDPEFLVAEGAIDPEDRELFSYAENADQIWEDILRWYELKGEPLLPTKQAGL